LATVFATAVPTTKKAMKLKNAENHGAQRAGIARVATTVATEFAASWKPLVKSNNSANTMTPTMATSNQSMRTLLSALTPRLSDYRAILARASGLDRSPVRGETDNGVPSATDESVANRRLRPDHPVCRLESCRRVARDNLPTAQLALPLLHGVRFSLDPPMGWVDAGGLSVA